jgi:hypothetical protein
MEIDMRHLPFKIPLLYQSWTEMSSGHFTSNVLVQPGTEWEELLSGLPLKTHAEIMEMMSGQRPLSEDVIEIRGEL